MERHCIGKRRIGLITVSRPFLAVDSQLENFVQKKKKSQTTQKAEQNFLSFFYILHISTHLNILNTGLLITVYYVPKNTLTHTHILLPALEPLQQQQQSFLFPISTDLFRKIHSKPCTSQPLIQCRTHSSPLLHNMYRVLQLYFASSCLIRDLH